MKRFAVVGIAAAAMVAALSSYGQTNVYSRNAVGAIRVDIPPLGGMVLCGFNFKPIGSNQVSLLSLLGTNLTGHAVATRATRVHMWDPAAGPGGSYLSLFFNAGGFSTIVGSVPTNPPVSAGMAFFLQSPGNAPTSTTVYLMGEVISSNDLDRTMSAGFMLVSNPYSAPLDLNDTNFTWIADGATGHNAVATRADTVYIWNGAGYDGFFLHTDGKWYTVVGNQYATNAIIPVGMGAWYKARTNFVNSIVRPYPWW